MQCLTGLFAGRREPPAGLADSFANDPCNCLRRISDSDVIARCEMGNLMKAVRRSLSTALDSGGGIAAVSVRLFGQNYLPVNYRYR